MLTIPIIANKEYQVHFENYFEGSPLKKAIFIRKKIHQGYLSAPFTANYFSKKERIPSVCFKIEEHPISQTHLISTNHATLLSQSKDLMKVK